MPFLKEERKCYSCEFNKNDENVTNNWRSIIDGINIMTKRNIPLKIWQTHKNNSFFTYSDNTEKLKELNNDCEYNFLNDNEIREYIKLNFNKNVLNAFDKIKPGAGRADIWRLAVILKEGGIYIDFDLKIKKNSKKFSQLIKPEDEMIHGRGWHI